MEDDSLHYPPGAEPEKPAPEPPQPEPSVEDKDKAPEPEAEKPEEKKPEEEKPEPEKPEEGKEPPPEEPTKKRSIYEAKQEEKARRKEAEAALATERSAREAAEARAAELQALLGKKDDAKSPEEKSEAKDAIDEWAEKQGLDGKAVRELTDIIKGALPKPEGSVLTKEEAEEWRAERTRAKAAAEDQAILNEGPKVQEQLAISDESELQTVMKEVVRLAHTKEFHDKEVDYIVWKNRDALAKMVSPKKPSFEQGGQRGDASADAEVEFSGKTTPGQAEKALSSGPKRSYEIRRSA